MNTLQSAPIVQDNSDPLPFGQFKQQQDRGDLFDKQSSYHQVVDKMDNQQY